MPEWMVTVAAQVLLFLLLCGLAASVDIGVMRKRMGNVRGLMIGMACQFILLPFLGFVSVVAWRLPLPAGVALMAVTSSPGGAYSNWWCSIFNADLALSVVMTMCSTVVSVVLTPMNLAMYTTLASGQTPQIEWWRLFLSMVVAVSALATGVGFSMLIPSGAKVFNIVGNVAGVLLITLSVLVSSGGEGEPVWDKDMPFYCGVAMPCVAGVVVASTVGWMCNPLSPPEAVALTVETAYQNTGLALTIALATFNGKERSLAVGVPLYYGFVQIVILPVYLAAAWKFGHTHAPADAPLWLVVVTDFQPRTPGPGGSARIAPMPGSDDLRLTHVKEEMDEKVISVRNHGSLSAD